MDELILLRARVADLEARLECSSAVACMHDLFDDLFEGVQVIDGEFRYVYVNVTAARQGRRRPDELIGRLMTEVYPGIDGTEMFQRLRSCMLDRNPEQMINYFSYPDGSAIWFELRFRRVPMGVLILSADVSGERMAAENLRRSEDDLATTLDCMADAVISTDIEGRVVRMNPSAELLTGWTEEEGRGRSLDELVRFLDQRTRHPVANVAEKVLREGLLVRFAHHTLLESRDGATRPVASSGAPIRDASGAVRGVVIVLRDMKEEYALTAMLQRAQKMEALGSLAAGVAHDFNNLLTVISGYSDILLGRLPPADPARGPIGQIKKAGEQAIVLTRQLLAFSRQQVLEPVVLNISGVVTAMHDMLARVVGERVEMASACEPGLANVLVDPGKLEQVIMNLVVNARDAMPEGGRLTIEASNVELDEAYADAHAEVKPGCYVMLAVSDTGCGMDAETQAQIFDPFFTTKAEGKGTGLGLATVFGIVRQSGGHIWVYSERDHGTMIKVYLPVVEQEASPRKPPVAERPPGGTETILVVEDDELVREITVEALRGCGYEILEAADGREAIEICEARSGAIDLLIADSVMPGMSGRVVAERIAAARPGIKVLFVSGYSEDTVIRHGLVESAIAFLQKPFSAAALAKKVREVLGQ